MHKLICLTILIVLLNYPIQSFVEAATSGFSIDLIHHDSPLSPFYNSSLTPSQILRQSALRSKARVGYFNSIQAEKTVRSTLHPILGGDYLMNLSFGTPPVSFLAIADTGSDLIWVKCNCQDCFTPQGSSSYSQVPCGSKSCQLLPPPSQSCGTENNTCTYNYKYGGGSSGTEGVLSSDTISLDSTSGKPVAFPALVFGCSSSSEGDIARIVGLVGLGGGPLSLISQLGDQIDHKFGYCFVPYASNFTSTLKFGQDAVISGPGVVSTPLITDTYYYLTLNGISVGQSSTQTPQNKSNIIIDSGTTLTFLEQSFYSELEAIVKQAIGAEAVQDPNHPDSLCYAANSTSNVPEMVFHFDGGDVTLTGINTFRNVSNGLACMTIQPSPESLGLSIFGNMAQINFQVEYDLQGKKLSFATANCSQK